MPHYIDLDKMQIIMAARGCGKSALLNALRELPAEDVAPVIHARWTKKEIGTTGISIFICSHCGYIEVEMLRYLRYCPECGAKMDEEI